MVGCGYADRSFLLMLLLTSHLDERALQVGWMNWQPSVLVHTIAPTQPFLFAHATPTHAMSIRSAPVHTLLICYRHFKRHYMQCQSISPRQPDITVTQNP